VLELAINTDYFKDTENPEPYFKKISEAGFKHIFWCHEWNTDYIYSELEIKNIIKLLRKYNLKVLDLHASEGKGNNWLSMNESIRIAGVELVKNRIFMANKLSSEVIVCHIKLEPINESEKQEYWNILYKSLNELKPYAKKHKVRIALENNHDDKDCNEIKKLLSEYDSDFLGFCYDSGHGNIGNGINVLKELKDRLISIHLHDNDGKADQHKLLFSGTTNWNELAKILVESAYKKEINMEVNMKNHPGLREEQFLCEAYATGLQFSKLMETYLASIKISDMFSIQSELKKVATKKRAESNAWFFKTGKGEYGEGDIFIGVTVPDTRKVAKKFLDLKLSELKKSLSSKFHEERLCALLVLVEKFGKANKVEQKQIFDFYLKNIKYVNNWDLVDLSAPKIVGEYLFNKPKELLYKFAKSNDLWERRISIVSTFTFIKKNSVQETFSLSKKLLGDGQDLIHKAVGWMLREAGKRNKKLLVEFLENHKSKMPRTMLRYSIEKFNEKERKEFLKK